MYREWSARGAEDAHTTETAKTEIHCYTRDPDGHLIELDQTTLAGNWHEFLIDS